MALRAGYYGVKRFLRDKLETIAQTYDVTINSLFPRSEQAVLGAKQLLTPNLSGYIPGELTVTNDNGVLTINGTLASQDNIVLKTRILDGNKYQYLPKGSYTFDCKGSSGSYRVFVGTTYNGSYVEWGAGSSVTFTIDDNTNSDYKLSDGSVLVGFWATIPANTYNNEKLYPLLTVAGDTDRTFAPYAMTNRELTDSASDQKTAINAIITAATGAADFAAFKTAMGAITPITRSLSREASPEDVKPEVIEEEKPVTKKTNKKTTVKEGE